MSSHCYLIKLIESEIDPWISLILKNRISLIQSELITQSGFVNWINREGGCQDDVLNFSLFATHMPHKIYDPLLWYFFFVIIHFKYTEKTIHKKTKQKSFAQHP